jgi:hypothetical protein
MAGDTSSYDPDYQGLQHLGDGVAASSFSEDGEVPERFAFHPNS